MNMKNSYKSKIRRIRSLHDLQSERHRLEGALQETEQGIHSHYLHIREALSFRNILQTVANEIALTTNAFSKTVTVGKKLFGGFKRKKKKKKHVPEDEMNASAKQDNSGPNHTEGMPQNPETPATDQP